MRNNSFPNLPFITRAHCWEEIEVFYLSLGSGSFFTHTVSGLSYKSDISAFMTIVRIFVPPLGWCLQSGYWTWLCSGWVTDWSVRTASALLQGRWTLHPRDKEALGEEQQGGSNSTCCPMHRRGGPDNNLKWLVVFLFLCIVCKAIRVSHWLNTEWQLHVKALLLWDFFFWMRK